MGLRSVTSDSRVVFPNLVSADAPPVIIPEGVSPSQNSRSGYCNKPFLNSDEKALCLRNQVKPFGEVVEVRPKSPPPPKPRGDEQYYDEFFSFKWLSDEDVPTAVKFLGTGLAIASTPAVILGGVTGCSDEASNACASLDETCDRIDEDCDGQKDEDFISTVCTIDVNGCLMQGETRCFLGEIKCDGERDLGDIEALQAVTLSCEEIKLSWSSDPYVPDSQGKIVIRRKGEDESEYREIAVLDQGAKEYRDSSLRGNTTYYYFVNRRDVDGYDERCAPAFTTTAMINMEEVDTVADNKTFGNPSIDIDSKNQPHIAYCKGADVNYTFKSGQGDWSHAQTLWDSGCAYLGFTLDQNDKGHILNFEECGGYSDPDLRYYNNVDGEWSVKLLDWYAWCDPTPVMNNEESAIAVSPDNMVAFLYDKEHHAGNFVNILPDGAKYSDSGIESRDPKLVFDNHSVPYITYRTWQGFKVVNKVNNQWNSEAIEIEFDSNDDFLILSFDRQNIPHSLYLTPDENQQFGSQLVHLSKQNNEWLSESLVTFFRWEPNCQSVEIDQSDDTLYALCGNSYIRYQDGVVKVVGLDINPYMSDGVPDRLGHYHVATKSDDDSDDDPDGDDDVVRHLTVQSCE